MSRQTDPKPVETAPQHGSGRPKRILLVTYSFPPFGGVGVHRTLSLAKYLPQNGYEVFVLTAKNPSAVGTDSALLAQVPSAVSITRTATIDIPFALKKRLKRRLEEKGPQTPSVRERSQSGFAARVLQWCKDRITPDPQVLWVPLATRAALRLVKKHAIDTVLVSAPPFSAFLIGNAVKKCLPHIKYVVDFRDEWIDSYLNTVSFNRSVSARLQAEEIERATISGADLVVAVTEAARCKIRKRYIEQPEEKFCTVTNGFDPEAFRAFTARPNATSKTLLTYVGTVYQPADPTSFATAVETLPPEIRSNIQVRFIGYVEDIRYRRELEKLADIVELSGFVPHAEAVARMEESDYLLLIWHDLLNIPGKFYDYLGTGKPILALCHPQSEVWRVLHETRAGWCADVRKVTDVQALLMEAHHRRQKLAIDFAPDLQSLHKYERPRIVSQYSELIEGCATQGQFSAVVPEGKR